MIALDTNVVVRVITRDDPEQARRAAALMKDHDLWLSKTVVLETEWVLRYTYGFAAAAVNRALSTLAGLQNLTLEDASSVAAALAWHERGMDFSDALHMAGSVQAASVFATFDRRLARAAARAGGALQVSLV